MKSASVFFSADAENWLITWKGLLNNRLQLIASIFHRLQ
jgi:hypothetical protein